MKTKLLALLLLLTFSTGIVNASHIVGMRITYEYTSGGYLFKLKMYRDCSGIAAPASVSLCFTSLSGCVAPLNTILLMDIANSGFEVPFNSCAGVGATTCNGGSVFAFEEYNYVGLISVPPCSDWVVAYSECCRNAAITNLVDPDIYNARVETTFDNLNYPTNSSPQFNAVPINYYCAGIPAIIDYSAYDVDGDSLSYEFTTIDGAGCTSTQIIPFTPPYTYDQPLATLSPTIFDPVSGQILFTPSMLQISVIGFKVNEYRNGVLIGSVRRDDEVVVVGGFVNPDTLAGRVYYDLNLNNMFDVGDFPASQVVVHMGPGNSYTLTSSSGKYDVQTAAGQFTLSLPNPPLYTTMNPSSYSVTTSGNGIYYGGNDFILQPIPNMNDLEITVNSVTPPIPGNTYPIVINYSNVGTTVQNNVDIVLTLDPTVQFVSSVPAPASSAGNTITWSVSSMAIFATGIISVSTEVDTLAQLGNTVTCSAIINSSLVDVTTVNNADSFTDIVVSSFDPNCKEVMPEGDIDLSFITSQQWISYKVNFQNLGTAPAQVVRILDLLDFDLELSSLEFVSSSRPCSMSLTSPNKLEFNFFGINLPPASVNEPGSHGYVEFRIKPKSNVAVNSYITNNAHIIFDFNAPIYTNLVANKVVTSTGINHAEEFILDMDVYPNPADEFINIEFFCQSADGNIVRIYNALGQKVYARSYSFEEGPNSVKINVKSFPSGTYFIELSNEKGRSMKKLMVN